jgi:hypothetical protein
MAIDEYIKTYGVEEGYNKGKVRWFVISNGRRTYLHYANKDFAMKKAEGFARACYKDFTRPNGDRVTFRFVKA